MPNVEITEEGRRGDVYGKSQVQGPDVTSVSPRLGLRLHGRDAIHCVRSPPSPSAIA